MKLHNMCLRGQVQSVESGIYTKWARPLISLFIHFSNYFIILSMERSTYAI